MVIRESHFDSRGSTGGLVVETNQDLSLRNIQIERKAVI